MRLTPGALQDAFWDVPVLTRKPIVRKGGKKGAGVAGTKKGSVLGKGGGQKKGESSDEEEGGGGG